MITLTVKSQDSFFPDTVHIEEVTISASKSYKNMQAGTTIVALDSLVLNNKINGSLADVLAQSSTVFIKSYGGGSVATASIRGTGASHTSLIWNGMPINSPMTGQADFSLIPVYFIDEANILMGAASLLNVGGALGGGVAVDNVPEWGNGWNGKIIQGYGSFNTYTGFGQAGWSNNRIALRSRLFYESSDNDFKYYNNAPNVDDIGYYRQKDNNYKRGGILNEAYIRLNQQSAINLKYWFQDKKNNIPKLMSSSAEEHNEIQDDQNQRVIASWQKFNDSWSWNISAGYADDKTGYLLKNVVSGTTSEVTNYNVDNHTQIYFGQTQAQYTGKNQWKLTLQLSENYSMAKSEDHINSLNYDANQNELSFLGAAYKEMGTRWLVSFLLRQHLIGNELVKPIPSLGTEFCALSDNRLKLKLNLSRNYHHPSLNDRYYLPGGNPDLKPEEGTTGEFAISTAFNIIKASLCAYYSIINDWILWEPSQFGYWMPQNIQTVHSRGVETQIDLKKQFGKLTLNLNGKYALTRTTNESNNLDEGDNRKGKQLIYIPKYSANFMFNATYGKFDISWLTYYAGLRYTDTSNDPNSFPLDAYVVSNIAIGKHFSWLESRFDIHMKIDNVFNSDYKNVIDRPMPCRSYSALVKFIF